mmetsp:Transcript_22906/g.38412  ORF Transcript_22906/g.38412 Transcript_22906/m.38412 type:complete len:258 (-) Transcript_22906:83-856(-)
MTAHIIQEDLRIHQVAIQILIIDLKALKLSRDFSPGFFKVNGLEMFARTFQVWLFAFEHLVDDRGREATMRLAEIAAHHIHNRVREGQIGLWILDLFAAQPLRHHHQRHIAHNFRRWRHLHDVTKHLVHVSIGLGDLMPALLQAEATRLRLKVGELTTWHFVQVDFGRGRCETTFKGCVLRAHTFPIVADFAYSLDIKPCISIRIARSLYNRPQTRLRSATREGVHCCVHSIYSCVRCRQNSGACDAGGVVRVEVDW